MTITVTSISSIFVFLINYCYSDNLFLQVFYSEVTIIVEIVDLNSGELCRATERYRRFGGSDLLQSMTEVSSEFLLTGCVQSLIKLVRISGHISELKQYLLQVLHMLLYASLTVSHYKSVPTAVIASL